MVGINIRHDLLKLAETDFCYLDFPYGETIYIGVYSPQAIINVNEEAWKCIQFWE